MKNRYDSLDTNMRLICNFRDISHTMRSLYEGKGSQKRILIILNETGDITQRELTKRLGIQPGSASEVISKLEDAGLIRRTPSKTDKRTTDISLTETGLLAAKEAVFLRQERHRKMFSCLTLGEKDTLLSLLEKVNASWDEFYRNNKDEKSTNFRKGCGNFHRK